MPNKHDTTLKQAAIEAARREGDGDLIEFFRKQAQEQPAAFLAFLGRILPLQVEAPPGSALVISSVTHVIVDAREQLEQLEKLPLINGKSDAP